MSLRKRKRKPRTFEEKVRIALISALAAQTAIAAIVIAFAARSPL